MDKKKKNIYTIALLLMLIGGIVLFCMLTKPKEPSSSAKEVSLRANSNDISIDDMMKNNVEKKQTSTSEESKMLDDSYSSGNGSSGIGDPANIARVQELIRENEANINAGISDIDKERRGISVSEDDVSESVKALTLPRASKKKLETVKIDSVVVVPKPKKRSAFNSISFGGESSKNAIKAYVHSEQTVMAGSTLKMRLGEDAVTDKGELIPKNSPIFGEVTAIDGERVIVKITHVNFQGNILPFEKQVYSKDAMLGIYVPGNPKADANKEMMGGAVDGLPSTIPGLDAASQIAGVVASTAAAAGKQVASKNVKKIKVTIKTNYEIYLRPEEN